ncbi:hypothetical protein ElyMa_000203400 [Elysia marginata]|uniref:Uncharacterized protein n=1 Tax=Elysia marginata TaxID=1093978 RepID=A0AAV4EY12_9GAST|nr:hypothetical protein ElyMa_000203400 [Elysia marginata]
MSRRIVTLTLSALWIVTLTLSALWPSGKTLAQRLGGVGSIPGRVKPKALKLILAADPPSVWHYGFSAESGRPGCQDNGTGCGVCKRSLHHSVAARFQLSQAPSLI